MKKCPTCGKEFEDSMRFCQADGTPLAEEKPFDPYATIVGTAAPAREAPPSEAASASSTAIDVPDDVLEIPEADPMKTVSVTDAEMREVLETASSGADTPAEEIRADAVQSIPPAAEPQMPSFGDLAPPPSPFAAPGDEPPMRAPDFFDQPAKDPSESTTLVQPEEPPQFETPTPAPVAEWTPPPAPDASWQNQEIGSNTPFQPPPAGAAAGENKTLAIVSLVTGILGLTICCGAVVPSAVAVVTGIMARNKASQFPNEFGGAGLAMGGIITGTLGVVGSIIWLIMVFFFGFLDVILRGM